MRQTLFLLPALLLLTGAHERDRQRYDTSYPELRQPRPANGAIFQAEDGYAPLTSGNRASAVGDIITIVLVERTQGSTINGSDTNREGSLGLTPPSTGFLSLFRPSDVAMGGRNEFSGQGRSTQGNSLNGEISVTVAAVFPNGNMLVRGEKIVRINRGDEFIRIAGIVRPQDITADNRVASTRLADARIAYSGRGEIARASRQGWLQRFFTMISPF